MLPASGAWQPNVKLPIGVRPSSWLTSPCSRRDSPMPPSSRGICGPPHPRRAHLVAQREQERLVAADAAGQELCLGRDEAAVDEVAHALEEGLRGRWDVEVHGVSAQR